MHNVLDKDNPEYDERTAAVWENAEMFDPKTEHMFRYLQVHPQLAHAVLVRTLGAVSLQAPCTRLDKAGATCCAIRDGVTLQFADSLSSLCGTHGCDDESVFLLEERQLCA